MTRRRRFRALYGAGPLHGLALVASFAIAGAAVVGWFQRPRDVATVLEWFAAAIVIHDLVLLPLYSLLDRIAVAGLRRRASRTQRVAVSGAVDPTPYLRIPAILCGLLLAVFFPVILGLGSQTELSASGIAERGYLARWLLATGVMFALSGVAYIVALGRAGASRASADPDPDHADPGPGHAAPDPEQGDPGPGQPAPEAEWTTLDPGQTPPTGSPAPAPPPASD
jgi:hypothetical protein